MPSVSFIIPSWNRKQYLNRLLDSIFLQNRNDYEVIVIDNASTDGTDEYLRSLDKKNVRVIMNSKNLGASQAKNQGVVASDSDILWFLDSDSELFDSETMSRGLELMKADSSIGVIGGEMNPDAAGSIVFRINDQYPSQRTRRVLSSSSVLHLDCDYIPTCNCMVRKSLIMKWGGFDPDYFITSEDTEMCFAVRSLGYRCVFDSRVTVLHHVDINARKGSLYLKYRNLMRFVLINMPWRQTLNLPVYFVKMTLIPQNTDAVINLKENPNFAKYIPPRTQNIASKGILGMMVSLAIVGLKFGTSVLAALVYTMINLPRILFIRYRRPDFLSKV